MTITSRMIAGEFESEIKLIKPCFLMFELVVKMSTIKGEAISIFTGKHFGEFD